MKLFQLLRDALKLWIRKEADQHAAALAYFTPFALTPLIIFSISIAGLVVGTERVTTMLLEWAYAVDPEVASLITDSVSNFRIVTASEPFPIVSTILIFALIFIAFNSFALGLQKMWDIENTGWRSYFSRIFRVVTTIIFLEAFLVAFVLLSTIYSLIANVVPPLAWPHMHTLVGFFCTVGLLTVIYGLLPLRALPFEARASGALVATTLLLFTREIVSLHVAAAPTQTIYGAAGLLISLLVWVYISSGIMLYGAAFTKVYADYMVGRRATKRSGRGRVS